MMYNDDEDEDSILALISNYQRTQELNHKNRKKINILDGVAIIIGVIIGSGIFSSPGLALERIGSPGLTLIAWSLCGILTMVCAHCYLELGGRFPNGGGDYHYLSNAFGKKYGFIFAWYNFFIGKAGSQAIIATVFGRYLNAAIYGTDRLLDDDQVNDQVDDDVDEYRDPYRVKLIGFGLIVLINSINCLGSKDSAIVSRFLTFLKFFLIFSVLIFSLLYISVENSSNFNSNLSITNSFKDTNSFSRFGNGLIACLWCFDGFTDGNFLQDEMKNPRRSLPIIINISLPIVALCYVLINIGYLSVLSVDEIKDSHTILVSVGDEINNTLISSSVNILPIFFSIGVSISTMGAINGSILTGGHAILSVARDRRFPSFLRDLNRFGAPYKAFLSQCIWSSVLILIPGTSFSNLLDYFGPITWLFYAASASSLIYLRYKDKKNEEGKESNPNYRRRFDSDRSKNTELGSEAGENLGSEKLRFKVPFYPLYPLIVILLACFIFISAVIESPFFTLLALGFVIISLPVYYFMEYMEWIVTENDEMNHPLLSNSYQATFTLSAEY